MTQTEAVNLFVLLVLVLWVVASLYSLVTGRDLAREHQHQSLVSLLPESFFNPNNFHV